MRTAWIGAAGLFGMALAGASPARAQDSAASTATEGDPGIDIYQTFNRPSTACVAKQECLVIVNNAAGYLVTALYIADAPADAKRRLRWSLNQFHTGFALQTHKAWWTHRSSDTGCRIEARVEMRDLRSGRKLSETEPQPFDLCQEPVTIVYVNPTDPKRNPTVTVLPAQ